MKEIHCVGEREIEIELQRQRLPICFTLLCV